MRRHAHGCFEQIKTMKTKEINNGRLAMLAFKELLPSLPWAMLHAFLIPPKH
jgi:hypothetical protein